MNLTKYRSDVILVIHFLLGMAAGLAPSLVFIWVMGAFGLGLYLAFTRSIRYPEYLLAAYLTGMRLVQMFLWDTS
ncbi:MAG: hypothetical protein U5K54_17645 [Cytophagales bacterium]|nr:hypothetical protein [Cytophagales bacterium]